MVGSLVGCADANIFVRRFERCWDSGEEPQYPRRPEGAGTGGLAAGSHEGRNREFHFLSGNEGERRFPAHAGSSYAGSHLG